jgi:hypothetical protein
LGWVELWDWANEEDGTKAASANMSEADSNELKLRSLFFARFVTIARTHWFIRIIKAPVAPTNGTDCTPISGIRISLKG